MRKVAGYVLQNACGTDGVDALFNRVCAVYGSWLESKGEVRNGSELGLRDGRIGSISQNTANFDGSTLWECSLTEQTPAGPFQTDFRVGRLAACVIVYVELRAGGILNQVGPLVTDVRCPEVVRSVLGIDDDWKFGETPLRTEPFRFRGANSSGVLQSVIWNVDRNLPLICISEDDDGPLTADFSARVAADLSGLSIVAHIDRDCAWRLTMDRTREWSCYSGAVRLYWPIAADDADPRRHPLWTKSALLQRSPAPEDASVQIRRQLRRRILGLSAFSVNEPHELRQIREQAIAQQINQERRQLADQSEWQLLADNYAQDNDRLQAVNRSLQEAIRGLEADNGDLRNQLTHAHEALRWRPDGHEEPDVEPEEFTPPATVTEAVERATEDFVDTVVFGGHVADGVEGLATDAGPPEKIYRYLAGLRDLAEARRRGPLGMDQLRWLNDRGISASSESETVLNSQREIRKRTWDAPGGARTFDAHLKPSDGTHPDRCVRIYFDFDEGLQRVIVGWVGRHPV